MSWYVCNGIYNTISIGEGMTGTEPTQNNRMANDFSLIWKQRTQHEHIAALFIQLSKEVNAGSFHVTKFGGTNKCVGIVLQKQLQHVNFR